MQVHEPIWKWRTQRTKNSIITIPRCNFDFYAPLSVENIQTHSYAISSLAGEKSQLRGKHATVSTTTTSLNGVKGMEKQMRLIKCHFHEFLHKHQWTLKREMEMFNRPFGIEWKRQRSKGEAISTEIEFFTTWCSCCPSHILIIPIGAKGQEEWAENGHHPRSN